MLLWKSSGTTSPSPKYCICKIPGQNFCSTGIFIKKKIIVGAKALKSCLWIWGQPWYPLKFCYFPIAMTFTLSGDLLVVEEFPAVNLQVNKIIVCSNNNQEMCTIRPRMTDNLARMLIFFPCPTKRLIIKFGHYNFRGVNRQCWQGCYIIFMVHLAFPAFWTLPAPPPNINQVWDFGNLTQAQ